jgi:plastocyanin
MNTPDENGRKTVVGRTWKMVLIAVAFLPWILSGCGADRFAYSVPGDQQENIIAIEADNFLFKPNAITARTGDHVVLQVRNITGYEHNLTLEDPQGNILLSLDLPPDKTVSSPPLILDRPGTYPFYCDKPFHTPLGMEGTIAVQ